MAGVDFFVKFFERCQCFLPNTGSGNETSIYEVGFVVRSEVLGNIASFFEPVLSIAVTQLKPSIKMASLVQMLRDFRGHFNILRNQSVPSANAIKTWLNNLEDT